MTTFSYDTALNITQVAGPGSNMTSSIPINFSYAADTTDPDGSFSQAEAIGEPLTVSDGLNETAHLRYSSLGDLASVRDAEGHKTGLQYNLAHQLLILSDPHTGDTGMGNGMTMFSYLYPGGPVKLADRYDENGTLVRRVVSLYGAEGELTGRVGSTEPAFYSYDAAYRTVGVTDGNHNTTSYAYSPAGNLLTVTWPDGHTVQFPSYDLAGRPLQRIDGQNVTSTYVYGDNDGLLSDIQYPLINNQTNPHNVHLAYDGYDRLLSWSMSAVGSEGYAWDQLDEPSSVTTTYSGVPAQTIAYTYWPDSSRHTMTIPNTYTGSGAFTYLYDQVGRPYMLTNPFGEQSSWAYYQNGWLNSQQLQNMAITSYGRNALGELDQLVTNIGANPNLSQFVGTSSSTDMRHDAAGNRTFMPVTIAAAPAFSGTSSYWYDFKDELVEEQTGRNGLPTQWFPYDPAGNSTVLRTSPLQFNASNQNLADSFDNNGNPTTYKGTSGYQYDYENRLTQAGNALTADYRGDGLRAWKAVPGGAKTYFLYDGDLPVAEFNAGGALTAVNTFGAAGLLSRNSNAANSSVFCTFDPQGNVCQRLDSSGNVLSGHFFDAFGSEFDQPSGKLAPFGCGARWGYYTDGETNLVLLTNRYYDPGRGRLLTRDLAGNAGGMNLYGYVGSNPLSGTDPLGLRGEDAPGAGV